MTASKVGYCHILVQVCHVRANSFMEPPNHALVIWIHSRTLGTPKVLGKRPRVGRHRVDPEAVDGMPRPRDPPLQPLRRVLGTLGLGHGNPEELIWGVGQIWQRELVDVGGLLGHVIFCEWEQNPMVITSS